MSDLLLWPIMKSKVKQQGLNALSGQTSLIIIEEVVYRDPRDIEAKSRATTVCLILRGRSLFVNSLIIVKFFFSQLIETDSIHFSIYRNIPSVLALMVSTSSIL